MSNRDQTRGGRRHVAIEPGGTDQNRVPESLADCKVPAAADSVKAVDLDPPYQRLIEDLLTLRGADPKSFHTGISPADEMFAKATPASSAIATRAFGRARR
jgi:hypothetical protein